MKSKIQSQRWDVEIEGSGYIDLVPWLKKVDTFTPQFKEQIAKRIVRRSLILAWIFGAIKDLRTNFNVQALEMYHRNIEYMRTKIAEERHCTKSHSHTWECGPCFECLGTGRTFLLATTRSRGTKCIACKGSGIRSQEFEESDFYEIMKDDDLWSHLQELVDSLLQPAMDFVTASISGDITGNQNKEFFDKESGFDEESSYIDIYKLTLSHLEDEEEKELEKILDEKYHLNLLDLPEFKENK